VLALAAPPLPATPLSPALCRGAGGLALSLASRVPQASLTLDAVDGSEAEADAARMRRVGDGDAAAFRELSQRHLAPVTRYAARLLGDAAEAEEVAQETFLRLWQQAPRWQPRAKVSTWLYRVAHNQCIDRLRRRREAGPAALDRMSVGTRPSQLLADKQVALEVELALAELPERQRAAVSLVHYQGLGGTEAAEVLEISVEALESLLARGRRALRERLAGLHAQLRGLEPGSEEP